VTFTSPHRKIAEQLIELYHSISSLQKTMQPNRKARRAKERQALKGHAEELRQRQRGSRKKVPRKPPSLTQSNVTSLFDPHNERLVGVVNTCIDWLWAARAILLGYITMSATMLITFFSATVDSKAARRSRSRKLLAARGVSRRHTETTSEEVDEESSVQLVERFE
jgi:hypothetical protein